MFCIEVIGMSQVHTYKKNQPNLGLFFRKSTDGKELDLVEEFVEEYTKKFIRYNKKNNLAVFIEPRLESGFPDIVFAKYNSDFLCNWNKNRSKVTTIDLKILSLLINFKGLSSNELEKFGFYGSELLESIERLLDAEMINRNNREWQPKPLNQLYGLKELIAVEAKLSNNARVIDQAVSNTWFASESYTLIDSIKPNKKTIETYSNKGIGMYGKDKNFFKIIDATKLSLPSSYVSLQFNEWVGNQSI